MKMLYRYDEHGNFINSYTERFVLANPKLTKDWILNENKPVFREQVPEQVPLWCLRQELQEQNLFDLAVEKIQFLEEPNKSRALNFLEYGNFVHRNSPTIQMLGELLGLDNTQIDNLFINSDKLEL